MKYKNVITGAIIDSPCLISSEDWEEVIENIANESEEPIEDIEEPIEDIEEPTEETEEPKKEKKSKKK
ncbi:hypothetical protein DYJ31_07785 [Parvimonas micra]|uniref:hypothetical protein n=1 Tax=Parvimonas micra TaxID=33033 RepID=UPI000E48AB5F|nr:hypothetical protein [Parvimonas micra]AXU11166.1 hypothetical protein DYJ31_07785 [Parvimonas micra]